MMSLFLMWNFLMSILFMFMKHPMSMGFILLLQTTVIAMMTGMLTYSYWMSYILFLIMVGGMLILFIYMTSLASNEMIQYSNKLFLLIFINMMIFFIIYLLMDYSQLIPFMNNINTYELINSNMLMKNEMSNSLTKIFNQPNLMMTLILINYLLLTLIAVVKIINIKSGPLRQKF